MYEFVRYIGATVAKCGRQEELGQSEDEPALVQTLRREYRGDMFWLICESIDDARKLTRRVPEAQKMLEPSSGFYDPYAFTRSSTRTHTHHLVPGFSDT